MIRTWKPLTCSIFNLVQQLDSELTLRLPRSKTENESAKGTVTGSPAAGRDAQARAAAAGVLKAQAQALRH